MHKDQLLLMNLEIEVSFVEDIINQTKDEYTRQIAKKDRAYLKMRINKLRGQNERLIDINS